MSARNVQSRVLRAERALRAFTLVEMLICVGAVALIAVGLGKLFSSTSQTVKVGKQVSDLNEAASMLERRIRQDVASISRAGPLIIRNKLITDPSNPAADRGVYLNSDKNPLAARPRRADEIGFMAQGRFTSAREPMWPGRSPGSSAAWITIGHGMQRDTTSSGSYHAPMLDDDPLNPPTSPNTDQWPPGLGMPLSTGGNGPNEFASGWILTRHVTVLARPQAAQTTAPARNADLNQVIPPSISQGWADSYVQIDLQPAAASVFRFDPCHPGWLSDSDMRGYGYETIPAPGAASVGARQQLPLPAAARWARDQDQPVWPSLASGIVDVASVDPAMIRTRILSVPRRLPVGAYPANNPLFSPAMQITSYPTPNQLNSANITTLNANFNSAHAMKMLMAAMLPGNDPWVYNGNSVAQPTNPLGGQHQEQRMMCAPVPPDFTGNLAGTPPAGQPYPTNQPYRQQDQAMLSASNLVVGCSEFIVEWSFGDAYPMFDQGPTPQVATGAVGPPGTLIWHGMLREGPMVNGRKTAYAAPYRGDVKHTTSGWANQYANLGFDAYIESWVQPDGTVVQRKLTPAVPASPRLAVPTALIHWPANADSMLYGPGAADTTVPLYSFFGYLDPTYQPAAPVVGQPQLDPDTLDWPWPKLLRFTIGLTDPSDPSVEKMYQFIVDLTTADQGQ